MIEETAVAKIEPVPPDTAEMLIAKGIEHNLPVESLEKLLAMRSELKREKAREQFFKDLATFQAKCPVITKTKEVLNKDKKTLRYKYAPLDEIIKQVGGLLKKYGFSYTIEPVNDGELMGSVCVLHHKDGHSESAKFTVPLDKDAYMNEPQKYASALTFSSRSEATLAPISSARSVPS